MVNKIIEEFRVKYPNFDFNKFLACFESGMSRLELGQEFNITELPLRKFVYSLGLEFIKNKRAASVEALKYRMSREDGEDVELVNELNGEMNILTEKLRALTKSLVLTRDENNVLRKGLRKEARDENALDAMLEQFQKGLTLIDFNKTKLQPYPEKSKSTQTEGLMLLLGDEHFGSVEKEDETGNNFNYDVATRRLNYMIDKVLTSPYQSTNLTIVELLDVTQGLLHQMEYLSEDGITTAMYKVVEVYTGLYERLAPNYKEINVYVTNSNHDRTTQKPTSYMKYDNFGIFLMRMVDMVLQAKGIRNIKFNFTRKEYLMFNINTADILVTHGDACRSYTATSESARAHLQSICLGTFGKPYKHALSGHRHRANAEMNAYGGYNITNGTLVGTGLYGTANGFNNINSSQSILFIDTLGDFESISFINLTHIQ